MTPSDRYLRALAAELSLDPVDLTRPSTRVVPEDDRAGSGLAVAYAIGRLVAIRCDPQLGAELGELASTDSALTFEELETWATDRSWSVVDGADNHVLPADVGAPAVSLPAGATLVDLDTSDGPTRALIAELIEATGPDDADEAEVELDDLDDFAVGLLAGGGAIGAYASARPWETDGSFDDIGVLVHPNHRLGGWGSGVVAALVGRSLARGRHPLYRCNWTVVGSKRVAVGLGFETVGRLLAVSAGD